MKKTLTALLATTAWADNYLFKILNNCDGLTINDNLNELIDGNF